MPTPRRADPRRLLPDGLSEEAYANAFLAEFGASLQTPAVFRDVIGERVAIGDALFRTADGTLKADKRGRGRWMRLLADALREPDEIWVRLEWLAAAERLVVRRRYVARFEIEGEDRPMLAVFERGRDGWWGVTTFQGEDQQDEAWRVGVRLYRRPE